MIDKDNYQLEITTFANLKIIHPVSNHSSTIGMVLFTVLHK